MRSERYRDLLPVERLGETGCTVIGVGAIGRQVAIQLASMGVISLQLIDPDVVEPVNLGPQGYWPEDIGCPKVEAMAKLLKRLNPEVDVELIQKRFTRHESVRTAVFCCVDAIETRRFIWDAVEYSQHLFIDGRMSAEVFRVLTVPSLIHGWKYRQTLFDASEAQTGSCTARSTIYCANISAGYMVAQFTKWLREIDTDFDIVVDLRAMDMAVTA